MLNIAEQINFWIEQSESDLAIAKRFLNLRSDLHYCLFFGHLALEKLLKGLVLQKTQVTPPKTHNLLLLVRISELQLEESQLENLKVINEFQIETRYPEYKSEFRKKCTLEFTTYWYTIIEEIYTWLKKYYQTK
jgi:HEPN domain-containing protein